MCMFQIMDWSSGSIIYRLAGHDEEVQCMVWQPPATTYNMADARAQSSVTQPSDTPYLLCTTSRDKTIRVWFIQSHAQEVWSCTQTIEHTLSLVHTHKTLKIFGQIT